MKREQEQNMAENLYLTSLAVNNGILKKGVWVKRK